MRSTQTSKHLKSFFDAKTQLNGLLYSDKIAKFWKVIPAATGSCLVMMVLTYSKNILLKLQSNPRGIHSFVYVICQCKCNVSIPLR